MRILLTGISGQVGGALLPRLQGFGQVIAADELVLNLVQLADISSTLDRLKPDLVINPAAYTAVDKAEDEPELALRVNGKGPTIVGQWAALNNVPLIHFSTDYVFNGAGDRAWREDDEASPLSVYGSSKLRHDEFRFVHILSLRNSLRILRGRSAGEFHRWRGKPLRPFGLQFSAGSA